MWAQYVFAKCNLTVQLASDESPNFTKLTNGNAEIDWKNNLK